LLLLIPTTALDLFSRKVVRWAMTPTMPARMVCDPLRLAIQQRRPRRD